MGKKPKTIISDEQKSIAAALKILERENMWDGEHLFDSFHILQKFKRRLPKGKSLHHLKQMVKAEN